MEINHSFSLIFVKNNYVQGLFQPTHRTNRNSQKFKISVCLPAVFIMMIDEFDTKFDAYTYLDNLLVVNLA